MGQSIYYLVTSRPRYLVGEIEETSERLALCCVDEGLGGLSKV